MSGKKNIINFKLFSYLKQWNVQSRQFVLPIPIDTLHSLPITLGFP